MCIFFICLIVGGTLKQSFVTVNLSISHGVLLFFLYFEVLASGHEYLEIFNVLDEFVLLSILHEPFDLW